MDSKTKAEGMRIMQPIWRRLRELPATPPRFVSRWAYIQAGKYVFVAVSADTSNMARMPFLGMRVETGTPVVLPDTAKDCQRFRVSLARPHGRQGAMRAFVIHEGDDLGIPITDPPPDEPSPEPNMPWSVA